ncbi:MAG: SDH family Clp fold serine proteinase [Bradymonadaceae bacterium]
MMDKMAAPKLFEALSEALGAPALLIAANWRGEYGVDLDEAALRIFYDLFDELLGDATQIAIVLASRGGMPAFADGVVRALSGKDIPYTVYIPCAIDGASSLIALGAREIVVHPFGGLGPVDAGPLVEPPDPLSLDAFEYWKDFPASKSRTQRKAMIRLAAATQLRDVSRRLARRIAAAGSLPTNAVEGLFTSKMGRSMALGAAELARLGLPARGCDAGEASMLWDVFCRYERELKMVEEPAPRFVPSDGWVDEVEFEPAVDIPAAVIATASREAFFELDTGSPDPDVDRLHGTWRW